MVHPRERCCSLTRQPLGGASAPSGCGAIHVNRLAGSQKYTRYDAIEKDRSVTVSRLLGTTPLLIAFVLAASLSSSLSAPPARAEAGSGRVVKEFMDALSRGDVEGAMSYWSVSPEVESAETGVLVGQHAVRDYLAALPLPLEVVSTLAWGGRRHEARILADGTPLLLTFQGGDGLITYLYIERDSAR